MHLGAPGAGFGEWLRRAWEGKGKRALSAGCRSGHLQSGRSRRLGEKHGGIQNDEVGDESCRQRRVRDVAGHGFREEARRSDRHAHHPAQLGLGDGSQVRYLLDGDAAAERNAW